MVPGHLPVSVQKAGREKTCRRLEAPGPSIRKRLVSPRPQQNFQERGLPGPSQEEPQEGAQSQVHQTGQENQAQAQPVRGECLKLLELPTEELFSESNVVKIRSAYKRLAKVYHPDLGGDTEKFKKLNAAHQQMLQWAENPHFTLRKALLDCWSYDGATNKWSPPL
ncbi:MAG: J domain-containing protein [Desulfobacteraceae bacterium]|nr:MAG: J domain-containing protein [Desulfobacteraceae bacterium]